MVLTPESYQVNCTCGREHVVTLERAIFEPGSLESLKDHCLACGYTGMAVAVYDENTRQAVGSCAPGFAYEVVLPAQGLHADERGTGLLEAVLPGEAGYLLAVGSGTIHDIVRYVAAKWGIPFVSVPTAASVDGFVSTVAAMTWKGYKTTLPAVSPRLLVADLDIIAAAPRRLTASGVGDLLGKYTALGDWRLGHYLTGEYFCKGIEGLMRRAVNETADSLAGLATGEQDAYLNLIKALVMSGVAMQLAGNSRPASGCEHHISHTIEMDLPAFGGSDALHGEKVGVGTLLCAEVYQSYAALTEGGWAAMCPSEQLGHYSTPAQTELEAVFGDRAEGVMEENREDCLLSVRPERLETTWPELKKIMQDVPDAEQIKKMLAMVGAPQTLQELGIREDKTGTLLFWSPYVRNRMTLLRLHHALHGHCE